MIPTSKMMGAHFGGIEGEPHALALAEAPLRCAPLKSRSPLSARLRASLILDLLFNYLTSVTKDVYRAYRSPEERLEGAKRIVACPSVIVSFNGTGWDLLELSKILDLPSPAHLDLKGVHHDMMPIISRIRWPPDPAGRRRRGPPFQA